jgi:hypothetical protein
VVQRVVYKYILKVSMFQWPSLLLLTPYQDSEIASMHYRERVFMTTVEGPASCSGMVHLKLFEVAYGIVSPPFFLINISDLMNDEKEITNVRGLNLKSVSSQSLNYFVSA